ncbi:MAG: hypothetical protein R8G66_05215 [Cytophagales bacterium]|nr:hypothetical protein [Cytophagales bacterium]
MIGCIKDPKKLEVSEKGQHLIVGTWKLISGTIIQDGDTTVTNYTTDQEMIKIINATHFAFLRHDLNAPEDTSKLFVAGGGTYTLEGNVYTEHLEYFTLREWEGNHFELTFTIDGDTLITRGVEEVADLNVKYYNIEKYYRLSR